MRPMSEWLNAPENLRLFQKIREDVYAEAKQWKYRLRGHPNVIDPHKMQTEIDARTIPLTEILKADASPEYLDPTALEARQDEEPEAAALPLQR